MKAKSSAFRILMLTVILLAKIPNAGRAAEPAFSWKTLEAEAVSLLSRYIQIDTTNPPGNEIKAAAFLKEVFDREGIEAKVIESSSGRGNIYARIRGDGSKKAIVLLNHMDVVPADAKFWKEAPFGGSIKERVIWGRGALDDKGAAIMELLAMAAFKRQNISLKGDVIFLGTADEEAGGALGAGYLTVKHPELFKDVGLVLNEGGGIRIDENGRARVYNVSVAEKTPLWLKLTASGMPGHGSTPGNSLAVNKLISALNRVMSYQSPIKVVPEVQKFYADTANEETEPRRTGYLDLRKSLEDPTFRSQFIKDPRDRASVSNTIAITLSFPAATSPPHPEAMKVISDFAKTNDPGAPVVAPLLRGFTDCHFFREKGIPCLGFMPHRSTPSAEGLVHGVDERVSVESLHFGVRAMYEIVRELVAE